MTLTEYIDTYGVTAKHLAEKIGCSAPLLHTIKVGRRPSWNMALKIEKATGGMVGRENWFPPREQQERDR